MVGLDFVTQTENELNVLTFLVDKTQQTPPEIAMTMSKRGDVIKQQMNKMRKTKTQLDWKYSMFLQTLLVSFGGLWGTLKLVVLTKVVQGLISSLRF